jgi:hypothetical protein
MLPISPRSVVALVASGSERGSPIASVSLLSPFTPPVVVVVVLAEEEEEEEAGEAGTGSCAYACGASVIMGREAAIPQHAVATVTTTNAIAACNNGILDLAFFMASWGFIMELSLC